MGVDKRVLVNSNSEQEGISTSNIMLIAVIALVARIVSFLLNLPFLLLVLIGGCFLVITVAPMFGYPEFAETVRTGMILCYKEIRELFGPAR